MDLDGYERIFEQMALRSSPWAAEVGGDEFKRWVRFSSPGPGARSISIHGLSSAVWLTAESIFFDIELTEDLDDHEIGDLLSTYRSAVDSYLGRSVVRVRSRWGNEHIVVNLSDGRTIRLSQTLVRVFGNIFKRRAR